MNSILFSVWLLINHMFVLFTIFMSSFLDPGNPQIVHRISIPSALAVDWIGKNLYWCDVEKKTLEVSKANGLYPTILVSTGLTSPSDLALDPSSGYLLPPSSSNPEITGWSSQNGHSILLKKTYLNII